MISTQVAELLPIHDENLDANHPVIPVKLNISGTGISYSPGDRISVLWEASDALVQRTLHALLGEDVDKADTIQVPLNEQWREALRYRTEYHNVPLTDNEGIPRTLPLRQFLRWGRLRPVSRAVAQAAYRASTSPTLLKIMSLHRESALEVQDLLVILKKFEGVDLHDRLLATDADGSARQASSLSPLACN